MTLHRGQHVTITGAAGTCAGEVLHVEEPGNLPSISGAPEVERVRAIMAQQGTVEIAMLGHAHDGRQVRFIALRDRAGRWRDLHAQPLTITPVHGEWAITDEQQEHE